MARCGFRLSLRVLSEVGHSGRGSKRLTPGGPFLRRNVRPVVPMSKQEPIRRLRAMTKRVDKEPVEVAGAPIGFGTTLI